MASKVNVDNTVNERRLRPIYGTKFVNFDDLFLIELGIIANTGYFTQVNRSMLRLCNTHGNFFLFFVYLDWLDNGNNKKALQEADKVLRKQPSNQCARVLKALALMRLGKEDECQVIMDRVRAEVPCEDSTLQAMSICYKEIHQRKYRFLSIYCWICSRSVFYLWHFL